MSKRKIIDLSAEKNEKPNIQRVEKSKLLERVGKFLPQLQQSNLQLSAKDNMEQVEEDYHIQMVFSFLITGTRFGCIRCFFSRGL
jgi:hypothetical protein